MMRLSYGFSIVAALLLPLVGCKNDSSRNSTNQVDGARDQTSGATHSGTKHTETIVDWPSVSMGDNLTAMNVSSDVSGILQVDDGDVSTAELSMGDWNDILAPGISFYARYTSVSDDFVTRFRVYVISEISGLRLPSERLRLFVGTLSTTNIQPIQEQYCFLVTRDEPGKLTATHNLNTVVKLLTPVGTVSEMAEILIELVFSGAVGDIGFIPIKLGSNTIRMYDDEGWRMSTSRELAALKSRWSKRSKLPDIITRRLVMTTDYLSNATGSGELIVRSDANGAMTIEFQKLDLLSDTFKAAIDDGRVEGESEYFRACIELPWRLSQIVHR